MNKNLSKTLSRLAAVQTCFQSFYDNNSLNITASEFNKYRFKKLLKLVTVKLIQAITHLLEEENA